jgi:hypothetical protein
MNKIAFLFLVISFSCLGQVSNIANEWEAELTKQFKTQNQSEFLKFDFSEVLSNQMRIDKDPWSTYIGVFGKMNKRIDFHLTASKTNDTSYFIAGKRKRGNAIHSVSGEINPRKIFVVDNTVYILSFDYLLNENGDIDSLEYFTGIGTIVFTISNNKPKIYWSEAGELRQYNNMFVGIWRQNNSEKYRECIFTFNPSGTHNKLPFRSDFYKDFASDDPCKCYFEIKEKYWQYGWETYDDSNGYKEIWWQ